MENADITKKLVVKINLEKGISHIHATWMHWKCQCSVNINMLIIYYSKEWSDDTSTRCSRDLIELDIAICENIANQPTTNSIPNENSENIKCVACLKYRIFLPKLIVIFNRFLIFQVNQKIVLYLSFYGK